MTAQQVRRSWLPVPAHRTELVERLDTFAADVIVLDLEDLVHDQRKFAARDNVRAGIERGVMQAGLLHDINEFDEPRSIDNSLEIHLSLENAEGNQSAMELIESSARVRSVSVGRADLVMDLRGEPNGELHLLPFLLERLVIVANASGVTPIGAWWQATSRGMRDGPEQVAAMNAGFTPSVDDGGDAWLAACATRDEARRQAIAWARAEAPAAHV